MKINDTTTIVDLAFNLSGSLAGIPVILPQLPVGERVGFDTLPKVWEDVDDIGQTWTPDLGGVEVDITVEAYNPTAIQKAPYTTDIGCIEHAASWGNALLDVLESGDWVNLISVPTNVTYLDTIRVINLSEPVLINTSVIGSQYFDAGSFPRSDGPTVGIVLDMLASGTTRLRISGINEMIINAASVSSKGVVELQPLTGADQIWVSNPDTKTDWFDIYLGLTVLLKYNPSAATLSGMKPPFDTGWAFERNMFVKIRR